MADSTQQLFDQMKYLVYDDEQEKYICSSTREAVFINNIEFEHYNKRQGGDRDKLICQYLTSIGYNVTYFENLSSAEIVNLIEEVIKKPRTDQSSFLFIVSSHGGVHEYDDINLNGKEEAKLTQREFDKLQHREFICGVDYLKSQNEHRGYIYTDAMISIFKENEFMPDKPKIFIIQACRGTMTLDRIKRAERGRITGDYIISLWQKPDSFIDYTLPESWRIPVHLKQIPRTADYFIWFAQERGYKAYRNVNYGSWLLQVIGQLIKKLIVDEKKEVDLLEFATRVHGLVAQIGDSHNSNENKAEMPIFESSFRKRFILKKEQLPHGKGFVYCSAEPSTY